MLVFILLYLSSAGMFSAISIYPKPGPTTYQYTDQNFYHMKKIYTLTSLIFTLLITATGYGQERPNHKKFFKINLKATNKSAATRMSGHETVSLPIKGVEYYWTGTEYSYTGNILHTYDANGNLIVTVRYREGETDSLGKEVRMYDNAGNETGYISYIWDMDADIWNVNYGHKTESSYDGNGRMTEEVEVEYEAGNWVNSYKREFSYPSSTGGFDSFISYEWNGTSWVPEMKITDVIWHDFTQEMPQSFTMHINDEGNWLFYERGVFTYSGNNYVGTFESYEEESWSPSYRENFSVDGNGNEIYLYEIYQNGEWVNESRDTEYVDSHGAEAGYLEEEWVNGAWETGYYNLVQNNYNAEGDLEESIRESGNGTDPSYKSKVVYTKFLHDLPTSVADKNKVQKVMVYPNPSRDMVNFENPLNESVTVRLYNAQNMEVLMLSTNNSIVQLDMTGLSQGLYFLKAETGSGKRMTAKVFKQ